MVRLITFLAGVLTIISGGGCLASGQINALSGSANPSYVSRSGILYLRPGITYQDQEGPLSYQPAVPSDGKEWNPGQVMEVKGEACQQGFSYSPSFLWLFVPWYINMVSYVSVGWDDGGYEAAIQDAQKKYGVDHLFDVRADIRYLNVIGVYQKRCVVINAKAVPGD